MSAMEIRTAEPRQSDGVVDWRHFWLTNVMIDSGKLEPRKIARYKMLTRKTLDAAPAQASPHESGAGSVTIMAMRLKACRK